MKEITLTCPFTGMEFSACEYADGTIVFKHPLTGEMLRMNYNSSIHRYNLEKSFFKHIETITIAEATEILGVTKQRMSQIIKNQVVPSFKVGTTTLFAKKDIIEYRDSRKVGAPCKEI